MSKISYEFIRKHSSEITDSDIGSLVEFPIKNAYGRTTILPLVISTINSTTDDNKIYNVKLTLENFESYPIHKDSLLKTLSSAFDYVVVSSNDIFCYETEERQDEQVFLYTDKIPFNEFIYFLTRDRSNVVKCEFTVKDHTNESFSTNIISNTDIDNPFIITENNNHVQIITTGCILSDDNNYDNLFKDLTNVGSVIFSFQSVQYSKETGHLLIKVTMSTSELLEDPIWTVYVPIDNNHSLEDVIILNENSKLTFSEVIRHV